jgi:RNA polymerase sigma factor (sigma-70 family)
MNQATMDVVSRVARQVAVTAASRCRTVDRSDLEQEAWVVCLTALPRYDPAQGDLGGYLFRAAQRTIWRYAWAQEGALSHAKGNPQQLVGEVLEERGVRVEIDAEEVAFAPDFGALPDETANAHEAQSRINSFVSALLADDAERGAAVWDVLTGTPAREAAAAHGVPLAGLYRATYKARSELREQGLLRDGAEQEAA